MLLNFFFNIGINFKILKKKTHIGTYNQNSICILLINIIIIQILVK